jgi:hypothetical protein
MPAGDHLGALCCGVVDESAHSLERSGVDQWADLSLRVTRIADVHGARSRTQQLGELVGHRAVDDHPLRGHADLALVHERTEAGGGHRLLEIRVRKHHERRLAPQLEQHPLQMAPGVLGDDPAHRARAGEVDPAGGRVRDELLDHVGGVGGIVGDQVDRTGRHAGVLQRAGDCGVGARTVLRRLEHHRVAAGQRRGHGASGQDDRRVPGRDAHHDAGGLAHSHRQLARHVRGDHLAGDPVGLGRRLAQHAGGELDVERAPAEGGAGLVGHDRGDLLGAFP